MDDSKNKRAGYKKFNDSLTRMLKKIRKKKTKTKKKIQEENLKTANIETSLFPKIIKPRMQRILGRSRIKTKKGVEGMCFKGLRLEYITRKSLNEAKKNVDIRRIIDIGKVVLQGEKHLERSLKCLTDDREPEKSAKRPNNCIKNLGQFSLSPISNVTFTYDEDLFQLSPRINENKKVDVEKEFENFSEKYEDTIATNVLLRLPKNGVLEDALNALKKTRKYKQTNQRNGRLKCCETFLKDLKIFEEFQEDETQFFKKFKYSTRDFESENPAAEYFVNDFILYDNSFTQETDCHRESLLEKSSGNDLFTSDESENYQRLSFQLASGTADSKTRKYAFVFQERNEKKTEKDLYIKTPPIHFYRRNMF